MLRQPIRGRAGFAGIGEDAGALEALFAHEIAQLRELAIRLAGKTDDERRSQRQFRQCLCAAASASASVSARLTRRCMRFSMRSLMCCNGMSRYGTIFVAVAIVSISSSVKWIG